MSAISILAERLEARGAWELALRLLEQMSKITEPNIRFIDPSNAFNRLAHQAGAAGNREIRHRMLEQMSKHTDRNVLQALANSVVWYGGIDRSEWATLLTKQELSAGATQILLSELGTHFNRRFETLDEAVKWFRDNPAPRKNP